MKRSTLFACIACIVVFDAIVIYNIIKKGESIQGAATTINTQEMPSAPPSTPTPTPLSTLTTRSESLKDVVMNELQESQATYAVAIKNLKTKEQYYFNEHKQFEAASLYKLWIMTTVYERIQNGDFSEDEVLSRDVTVLNKKFEINPEDAELTEGIVTFSVKDAINEMITISNNYAALLLSEKIGLSKVRAYLKLHGFLESSIGSSGQSPTISASDALLFFEELYNGHLGNVEHTQKMMSILKLQKLNNKIPKYLPSDISIAHKTGELNSFSHDVGIIFTPKNEYIIALFSDSNNPEAAEERLSKISKAVYKYFEN